MKKLLLIAIAMGFGINQVNAQLCLGLNTDYNTNQTPYRVVVADFNNDGKQDLATVNSNSKDVSVFLGTGSGTFGTATNYTASTVNYLNGICVADFNNDFKKDLAVTISFGGSSKVGILLGNGTGGFGPVSTFTVPSGPIGICSGDFNGDGSADLATANNTANNVAVMFGNGNGTFGSPNTIITMSSNPRDIICADFNNDTKPDLATTDDAASGSVSIYLNQGTGTFSMGALTGGGTNPNQLVAADFTGDNNMDIAVTYFGDGVVGILPGQGNGSFGTQSTFAVGANPVGICVGDFDGDFKKDVAVTNYNSTPQLFVMLGDGMGNLGTGTGYNVGTNPYGIASGDFDNNGRTDVVTSNYNSNNISVLLNGPPQSGITGNVNICSAAGGTTITAASALSYTWSTGGNNQSEFINPGAPGTYFGYYVYAANGSCNTYTAFSITVTATPTITITGSTNICSGVTTVLTASVAGSYTWSSNAGGVHSNTVAVSPTSNTTYTVDGQNGNCYGHANTTVNVAQTPTVNITGNLAICNGQNTTLNENSIALGFNTGVWSNTQTSSSINVSPTVNTTYSLVLTNSNTSVATCTASGAVTVSVTPNPTVTISNKSNLCYGASEILSGNGATSYTWSSNAGGVNSSTVSVNPTTTTNYTLSGGDPLIGGTGQCVSTTTTIVNVVIPAAPSICMVTVDSLSKNNLIIWDKTLYPTADTFYVYRDTANNNYCLVGRISKSQLSEYVDTARHIGAVNGDPNITTYRYKLGFKDSCGNVSPMSPYHNTIYQYNSGSLFLWNAYQIEGQPNPVPGLSSYVLKRDNLGGTGTYVTAATAGAASTSINDPQYSTYQLTADWRVETVWSISCTPSYLLNNNSTQSAVIKSKSNITNNRPTSVKNNFSANNFSLYPNPTNGNLTINFTNITNGKVSVKVVSVLGEEAYNETIVQPIEKLNIDLSKYESGVYLVQVTTNSNTVTKRIVKN